MTSKNITLHVNDALYNKYRKYCKDKGLLMSRQFEIMMEEQMEQVQKQ